MGFNNFGKGNYEEVERFLKSEWEYFHEKYWKDFLSKSEITSEMIDLVKNPEDIKRLQIFILRRNQHYKE